MKDPVVRRWIVLGTVWILAVILTSLNVNAAFKIREAGQERETRRKVIGFFDIHEELMEKAVKETSEYTMGIPSIELGMLAIEELIFKTSVESSIRDILTEFKPKDPGDTSIRLKIVFSTAAHNGFRFLEQLENEYPFVAFESFTAMSNREARVIDFLLDLQVETTLLTGTDMGN